MRISDWSSDVCSSDLSRGGLGGDGFPISRSETHPHPSLPLEGEGDKRLVARDQFVANIGVHPASIRSTRSASSAAARGRPIDAATAPACGSLIVEANDRKSVV